MKTAAYPLTPFTLLMLAVLFVLLSCNSNNHGGNDHDSNNHDSTNNDSTPKTTPKHFVPPDDNTLSEQQVLLYIEVKQREKQLLVINENAPPAMSRHYNHIETQAAQESNLGIEEYLWIKNNIINAGTQSMLNGYFELNNKIIALLEKTLARRMETRALTEDPAEVERIDIHINEIKQQLLDFKLTTEKYTNRTESVSSNLQLFEKYKTQLESVSR